MRDEVAFLILQNINKGLKTEKYIINEYVLYSEFVVRDLEAVCMCRDSGILFEYAEQGTAVVSHRFLLTSPRARFPTLLFSALVSAPSPLIF